MTLRLIAALLLASAAASCSGAVYDASDFAARTPASSESADAGETTAEAPGDGESAEETAAATDETPSGEDAGTTDVASVEEPGTADVAAGEEAGKDGVAAGVDTDRPALAGATGAPRGLLAFFRTPDPSPGEDAAAEAFEDLPEDELSEAEIAGEVEADPDVIAVPEEPLDDGLKHDFVNVYTSRPEAAEPLIADLPGVNWQGGLVLVSRTPDGDPGDLFGGSDHPFARAVPGIPRKTVQAANGLLLAHSAINVGCVKPDLLNLVRRAESHFGKKVVVTSGYRSPGHNRRVRGAVHSQHLYCNALDLFMPGVARDDLARFFFAQPDRGGIGLYCHTRSIHIDTGKRRQWRWNCRRRAG